MPHHALSGDASRHPPPLSTPSLAEYYAAESLKIRERYETTGEGSAALRQRSDLVDGVVLQLCREHLCSDREAPEGFCLVALGGYGRRELFPHSDIDLLFLTENGRTRAAQREAVAAISRELWDLRLRVGQSARTLEDCGRLHRDNLEFNVSLLDCRLLAGDSRLFAVLREDMLPHLAARDHRDLLRNLAELTRRRHAKHGNTIFHLEPNLKEAPGGLRDYHVCRWATLIAELERSGLWAIPEDVWPTSARAAGRSAFEFLASTRCFLHYRQGRDDNQLSYELQDQAAAWGVGESRGQALRAADWMRDYFQRARSIDRLTDRLLNEAAPVRSSLYGVFQEWRSRLSNADFSVVGGRIFVRQPSALEADPGLLLRLFEMAARHGLELSREAERWVERAVRRLAEQAPRLSGLWPDFRRVIVQTHAAGALREMHRLGLLTVLFPEFQAIDSLVVRDYYHRYTVDEHSFIAIQNLQELRGTRSGGEPGGQPETGVEWVGRFAEILAELEQPDLLLFSLLFHDVGKGMHEPDHVQGSLKAVEPATSRLELNPEDCETVCFLIRHHLEMSATFQRRDVFDPETLRAFTEKVRTPERLKMLCLFTYADIKAVNPEALRPWKAELLWQLYVAAFNYLTRSLDEERVGRSGPPAGQLEGILSLLATPASPENLRSFLDGFPRRYLAVHSREEIAGHFERVRRIAEEPVQVGLRTHLHLHELTVITPDRPFLFASITGTLAAWGMNIVKADAFANTARIVLDTFRFADLYRTLEMNPPERERLKANLVEVLNGKLLLEKLMSGRINAGMPAKTKIQVSPRVRFDRASSSHSTLLELIAQDRPGLLYQISSTLATLGCNIEIALIDTEGQKAIDVFYLTCRGAKLDDMKEQELREALLRQL